MMTNNMAASKQKHFRRTVLASLISMGIAAEAQAGTVRSDVDYQYFRDFAENKGQFAPGVSNVEIFDKQGQSVGTMLKDVPMPDFAPVSSNGVAILSDTQYVVSAQHNVGYGTVRFGQAGNNPDAHHHDYKLVDRNNFHDNPRSTPPTDFHAPRLDKLVTEVAPMPLSNEGNRTGVYTDPKQYSAFLRIGAGSQSVRDRDQSEKKSLMGAYQYLTAGAALPILERDNRSPDVIQAMSPNGTAALYENPQGPLSTITDAGDSGSPLIGYDVRNKRWATVGVLYGGNKNNLSVFSIQKKGFFDERVAEDIGLTLDNSRAGQQFDWTGEGNGSTLTNPADPSAPLTLALADTSLTDEHRQRPSLNHGKTLVVKGQNGTLNLKGDINQGAGALKFETDFTVTGERNDAAWLGAGVDVAAGKTVQWRVHNPQDDRLSKIGAGTLRVNGLGANRGHISVGDGTVVLAQQADGQGNKQAFAKVGIVSGRPTVVLDSADQVNPDNIYFGFRGGRLDVNGNSLTFNRIQNADKGARIANNHRSKAATVTLARQVKMLGEDDVRVVLHREEAPRRTDVIFQYNNNHQRGRQDFFRYKEGGNFNAYYPTNATSNDNWEFLATGRDEAVRVYLERENAKRSRPTQDAYHGFFGEDAGSGKHNGKLDVVYRPELEGDLLMLSGGANLNGNLTVQNGTLLLSGAPVPHAYDFLKKADVVRDDEWLDSNYTASFRVGGKGVLQTGRNVPRLNGNLTVEDKGHAIIGLVRGETPVCVRSDFNGKTVCDAEKMSDEVLAKVQATRLHGDATLRDAGKLTFGNRMVYDRPIAAERGTTVNLAGGHWKMPQNTVLGNLDGKDGQLTLNPRNKGAAEPASGDDFRTLTVNGDLSGSVRFHYLTDLAQHRGDQVVVNGLASGNHTLSVRNTGAEPADARRLTLLALNHGAQAADAVRVNLVNQNGEGHVDAGSLRYTLVKDERNRYYLHNAVKEAELAKRLEEAEKAKQAEAAKKLADAEKARADAEKLAQEAVAARDAAVAAAQAAEEAKRRLQDDKAAGERALQAAQTVAQEAQRRTEAALAAQAAAERLRQEAQAQREAAETAKNEAQSQLADAHNRAQAAENARDEAQRAAQSAQTQAQAAQAAQTAAEARSTEAERQLAQARRDAAEAAEAKRLAEEAKAQLERNQHADAAALAQAQTQLREAQAAAQQAQQRADAAQLAATQAQDALATAQRETEAARQDAGRANELAESRARELAQAQTAQREAAVRADESARRLQAAEEANRRLQEAAAANTAALDSARQTLAETERRMQAAETDKQAALAEAKRQQQAAADAEAARAAAQAQARAAEEAKNRAETARNEAEAARRAAEEAQRRAEAAKNGSEQQLQNALANLGQAQREAADKAERLKLAEAAHTAARAEAAEAERLRGVEQQARERAEAAARTAETARQAAETAQAEARAAQARAESLKNSADAERDAALAAAETARQTAADKTKAAEQALAQAQQAETARVEAVDALKQAQTRFAEEHAARTKAEADLLAAQAERSQEAANRQTAEAQARAEAAKRAEAEAEARRLREAAAQAAAQTQQQAQLISRAANTALSEVSAQTDALVYAAQGIDARLAQTGAKHNGIWASADARKTKHVSDNYRAYSQNHTLLQLGIDQNTRTRAGDLTAGVAFSHVQSKRDYAENVTGAGRSTVLSGYGKLALDNGVYLTAEAGYGRARSEIGDTGENAPVKRHIAHAAAAVGGNIKAGSVDVRPEIGVRYYHVGSAAYDLHDNATDGAVAVRNDSLNLVGYQAGVRVSQTFTTANGTHITPHLRTAFHDIDREASVSINGRQLKQRFGKYWENEAGIGVNVGNWHVSARAVHSTGNEKRSRQSAGISVGYRW
ncbi:S6 family peptidase [Conchiformibius kuhniae]|uniref:S6 family peptidase n=2 Tax=Conchiformibius kuhniae TaxID=211502 RepID=A0ABD8B8A2_9NEIS|nr:S6 family peptidase [Conchiformibius kuhniae]